MPSAAPSVSTGLLRATATGAATLGTLYALCWVGLLAGSTATHAYLSLFVTADPTSVTALSQGVCWSLLFGAVAGFLVGLFYNLFGFLVRK